MLQLQVWVEWIQFDQVMFLLYILHPPSFLIQQLPCLHIPHDNRLGRHRGFDIDID